MQCQASDAASGLENYIAPIPRRLSNESANSFAR